ncbi:ethanolamine ammonia-lyase subunit EutB [Lentilactobacillus sp. IMAU92037]|uniref:ethanolamine ammonia-lyase subunit EutB n=1 Tax=Lentilactobacillus TaxID=2767893 RepID=UPI001C2BEC59|nr:MULTISPECIES: ethanolamine ammonia-lyase subunit EutB [Lentilactobacillus]MBV0929575.1 ethanolamine ammonia-lyase subunit EutB [Lentilactobacillus dabitei]MDM7515706.1 ethanolamine ammonia-lyase subunit EutB [Lentilactobacillus sp. TOM.63]
MILQTKLFDHLYSFGSVKEVLAKANEVKSGDELAGVAATDATERVAAKVVLSNLTLQDIYNNPVVPYEDDEVTRIIIDGVNKRIYEEIKNWTVSDFREWILDDNTQDHEIKRIRQGITSEMAAAVTKLMTNMDLVVAAKKIDVEKTANTTIGRPGTFSSRLQTNHPTDDIDGIMAGVMEGLSMGIGDAVIGLNPNDDSVDNVVKILNKFEEFRAQWDVPTQCSVLAHVTTQMEALKRGAPVGLCFQSIAGSEKGNTAFGITADMLSEARDLTLHQGQAAGPNVMYFETGEGSELSAEANFGADELTMESRCYGFAKKFDPYIVNTVVGFIGPEYLYNSKQVIRAGLEDHFMGKLQGISMGCDVCYTNHMKADQNDAENLAVLLGAAGCNYIMGVPHADDVMLNYESTGYQETATIREIFGYHPIKEFEEWMENMDLSHNGKLTERAGDASIFLN